MRVISTIVAATAVATAGVSAGKGKRNTQGSSAGNVLSGMFRAAGMGAALGGLPTGAGADVHPLFHETHNGLTALLSKPCVETSCPMEERFRMWANQMHKPYVTQRINKDADSDEPPVKITATPGYEDEYAQRLQAFAENVKNAHSYNVQSKGKSVHGITKFMDMPEDEFMRQSAGMIVDEAARAEFEKLPKFQSASKSEFLNGRAAVPNGKKDWAADGFTTEVKDQARCGSCWAFSTVEQVESEAIKQGITDPSGENYVLSPQELVSCDHAGDEGCHGGLPLNALGWLQKKGLEQESDYPYMSGVTSMDGKCKYSKSKGVIEVDTFEQVSSGAEEEDDMNNYLLTEGPLSVGVHANNLWQTYIGGVMKADQCMGQLDHAVQAVGLDTESDDPTIKVRNSWGSDWGEDGYIRLVANTNTCGIADMTVKAKVKAVSATSQLVV